MVRISRQKGEKLILYDKSVPAKWNKTPKQYRAIYILAMVFHIGAAMTST